MAVVKEKMESSPLQFKELVMSLKPTALKTKRSASELGAVTSNACAEGHRYDLVIALLNCSVFRARHREATQSPSSMTANQFLIMTQKVKK
jgi:hypothetical protein